MARKPKRRFSMRQCFVIIGIESPKIKGKTQAEVDAALLEWKEGELKRVWRARVRECHPDHGGDATVFNDVQEAYDQISKDLKIRLRKPKKPAPDPPTSTDSHCPSGHQRFPPNAKFCHECGHSYNRDGLELRLLNRGLTRHTMDILKADGTLARLRTLPPFSKDLENEIEILFHRQRLGLIGPNARWQGF